MKINIGAGGISHEDYVTIDYDPKTNPDHVLNLEQDRLPFDNSSVEVVVAHHIFEHLGDGFFHCLQELYRVCRHGALIDVRVPHPNHESFLADPTHRRPITVMTMKLFSQKFNDYCRQQQLPASRLGEYYNVDFEIMDFKYVPDQKARQLFSQMSAEELQEYANQHNNIISEIHMKLVVVKYE